MSYRAIYAYAWDLAERPVTKLVSEFKSLGLDTVTLAGDSALTFDGSELLALDRSNGKERWQTDIGAGPNSFVSAAGGRLFIGLPSGDVVALGSADLAPGSPSPTP